MEPRWLGKLANPGGLGQRTLGARPSRLFFWPAEISQLGRFEFASYRCFGPYACDR